MTNFVICVVFKRYSYICQLDIAKLTFQLWLCASILGSCEGRRNMGQIRRQGWKICSEWLESGQAGVWHCVVRE